MNLSPTDIKLFELFANKEVTKWCIIKWLWEIRYVNREDDDAVIISNEDGTLQWHLDYWETAFEILWHEPQLHDVFRVAKERWTIISYQDNVLHIQKSEFWKYEDYYIQYNPTLPLLSQEEPTKSQLIKCFTP